MAPSHDFGGHTHSVRSTGHLPPGGRAGRPWPCGFRSIRRPSGDMTVKPGPLPAQHLRDRICEPALLLTPPSLGLSLVPTAWSDRRCPDVAGVLPWVQPPRRVHEALRTLRQPWPEPLHARVSTPLNSGTPPVPRAGPGGPAQWPSSSRPTRHGRWPRPVPDGNDIPEEASPWHPT